MSFENFIFIDIVIVKVGEVTGSDVIVGTLLKRNSLCNRELYVFLAIFCMWTITKGSITSKNMPTICVFHASFIHLLPPLTSLPVTNLTLKKSRKMKFLNDKLYYVLSQKDSMITNMQNPQSWYKHFKNYCKWNMKEE